MKRSISLLAAGAFALSLSAVPMNGADAADGKALFGEECSACHMAYQPFFLPKRSWITMMNGLSDHFGEDASLDDASRRAIEAYLVANAADRNGRMPRWLKKLPRNAAPQRISELSWFRHEHGSRVSKWIKKHPEAGSVSNCVICHKGAERGYYDDD
ncbi:MAG: cytochrome C [Paracoccaceae bacterium]